MSELAFNDWLARWYLKFQQFEIVDIPQEVVKGQTLVDFSVDHPIPFDWKSNDALPDEDEMDIKVQPPRKIYFDGAIYHGGAGTGMIFFTSREKLLPFSFTLKQCCSNNVAKYQALILGHEMAINMKQL